MYFNTTPAAAPRRQNVPKPLQRNIPKLFIEHHYHEFMPRYADPNKFFIYECNCNFKCGGLSDRQRGMVTAYLISLLTNRTFGIKHTCPRNLQEVLVPNKINWDIHPSRLEGKSIQRHYAGHNIDLVLDIPTTDFNEKYTADVVYFQLNKETVEFFRRHKDVGKYLPWLGRLTDSQVYYILLNLMFKPSKFFQDVISKFFAELGDKPLICAHLRLGGNDNPTIHEDTWIGNILAKKFNLSDTDIIFKHLHEKLSVRPSKLFVASDSDQAKKLAKKSFPSEIVDTPGVIGHIDTSDNRFELEAFLKAIMDQYILSSCDSLLLTISGYGIRSGYLRGTSDNLYCFFKHNILDCSLDNINMIYEWI